MTITRGWIVSILLFLLPASLAVTPHNPNTLVGDWIRHKCGDEGRQQLWKYQGALYDPLDGRRIATVQGLELVTHMPNTTTGDLEIFPMLQDTNATYDEVATVWSQNVFGYTTEDSSQLLREIRVRPNSPRKQIPLDQAVAAYETATTYISRNNGDEVLTHSEFPDGSTLWGSASTKVTDGTLEFTVYTKRRSKKSPLYLPDLAKKPQSSSDETVLQPKRSSLIQFGSGHMETQHKFGARETYSMSVPKPVNNPKRRWKFWGDKTPPPPQPRLRYTRYGEGPPFYAPGRMCMLELQADPIESLEEAPSALRNLLLQEKRIRGWNTQGKLQLLPEPTPKDPWSQRKRQVLGTWERLRAASTLKAPARN